MKRLLLVLPTFGSVLSMHAQLLTWSPLFTKEDDAVQGNFTIAVSIPQSVSTSFELLGSEAIMLGCLNKPFS
jgi:hypothetical protein